VHGDESLKLANEGWKGLGKQNVPLPELDIMVDRRVDGGREWDALCVGIGP